MTRVLLVGLQPEAVDYSDPALPPGMDAKKIQVERRLGATTYDCVVIGAGVRLPPKNLCLFETIVNTVHKAAPKTSIAFNTVPEDSADAAARWLSAANSSQTG